MIISMSGVCSAISANALFQALGCKCHYVIAKPPKSIIIEKHSDTSAMHHDLMSCCSAEA
jgi:hypothetical protein